ncbi:hypothetical protein Tsubulata_011107 [Turnera subulata]|uniref:Uncharacterized protein n=1 Tax=Turnera subulata TaxID=218843 RepID=A0A9Q0GC05_9ROSI|nr:hypothetical protein Tsubulata_011107 [Turnera subulata]
MGNWRNRPPRRFFHNPNRYQRSYYDPDQDPDPPCDSGYVEDGIPLWEKKFCSMIGSVPWRKVVDAKKFAYCHSNILNWDDSAGEEAFRNAKKRYWAEINGLPCDCSPPNPDIYVDEINWHTDVDPELIRDLEQALVVPDEGENNNGVGHKKKKLGDFEAADSNGSNKRPSGVNNPWESSNQMGSYPLQGWNECGSIVHKDENPWESSIPLGNEPRLDNAWGGSGDNAWRWKQNGNCANQKNDRDSGWNICQPSWESEDPGKDQGWGNARDSSWGHWESRQLNSRRNSWERNVGQGIGTLKDRGRRGDKGNSWTPEDEVWREREDNSWNWKQRDNNRKKAEDLEITKYSGGWTGWDEDCRRKGGAHRHVTSYQSTRVHGDYYRKSRWRG